MSKQKTNWLATGIILLASLVLFIGAGTFACDSTLASMLIPILLIHELGHYVAP